MSTKDLANAYTRIADDYDRLAEGDAWMREFLWERYLHLFAPGQHVLDIGCGTGTDALFLATCGMRKRLLRRRATQVHSVSQKLCRASTVVLRWRVRTVRAARRHVSRRRRPRLLPPASAWTVAVFHLYVRRTNGYSKATTCVWSSGCACAKAAT